MHNNNECNADDDDAILGLRKYFCVTIKEHAIDNASTNQVDDTISIEVCADEKTDDIRKRYWMHISDADRGSPKGSDLLEISKRRSTSSYLHTGALPMFPYRYVYYSIVND